MIADVLHIAADGAAKLIDEPNREVGLTSTSRTVIVRLNGGADELSGRERDTYVVSEDDYIDYLSQSKVSELLPGRPRRATAPESPPVHRLRPRRLESTGLSPATLGRGADLLQVMGDRGVPNRLTSEQWRQLGVDTLQVTSDESLEELQIRIASEFTDGATP